MILITGDMGFIGVHTTRCLLDAGEQVVISRFNSVREPEYDIEQGVAEYVAWLRENPQ